MMSDITRHQHTLGVRGLMSNVLGNYQGETSTPPSATRLLKQERSSDQNSFTAILSKRSSGEGRVSRNLSGRMELATNKPTRASSSPGQPDGNFTIGAIHGSSSRSLLRYGSRQGSNSFPTTHSPSSSQQQQHLSNIASTNRISTSNSSIHDPIIVDKKNAPELAALERELKRMFKLQLGPLTIQSDIPPVLQMWGKLADARDRYGRKTISITWLQLAHATAIVARKMTMSHVNHVLEYQLRLVYPCPPNLNLPAGMLIALADRARSQLVACKDEELLKYCSLVGRLLVMLIGQDAGTGSHPSTLQQGLKGFGRVSNAIPLAHVALLEMVRRGKASSSKQLRSTTATIDTDEPCHRTNISTTLLIADALGELSGAPLSAPALCLHRAAAAASAEAEGAMKHARSLPWYSKMTAIPCISSNIQRHSIKKEASVSIPTQVSGCASESLRLAGETAECLARCLVPAVLPLMTSEQLTRLAVALRNATSEGDEGQPTAEPLRQSLGMVLAEVSHRAAVEEAALSMRCVKEVIGATRTRLLHVQFRMVAPEGGVAAALASLESWKWKDRQVLKASNVNHAFVNGRFGAKEIQSKLVFEKEASSLEMRENVEEEGEEVQSSRHHF